MVKIRLRRTGAKKQPSYRIVVADSRSPRDGRFIEIVGHYNPRTEPVTVSVQEDRVLYWLSVGAQMTDPVERLLENLGTLDRFARLKQGAELEELLTEAEATREKRVTEAKKSAETKKVQEQVELKEETEITEAEVETEEEPGAEVSEGVTEEAAVDADETSSEDA